MSIYGNIVGGIDEKIAVDTSLSVSGAAADAKATGDKIAESVAGLATENFVTTKIAEAELSGGDVDLSGYATKDELTTLKYAGSSTTGGAATSANSLNCIEITDGTDLNTLTTPGFYRCKTNVTAESLINCPTAYAFFMIVGAHTGNGVFQELTTHQITGMQRYMRNYYNEWGNWIREQTHGNLSLSNVGTEIPDSSDLNSYIISGRYYCLTATNAETLTNCPITDAGFTLVVMNSNNGRYQQFLYGYQSRHIYYRGSYSSTDWQDWTDLSKTTLTDLGITATATELNYVSGVTSAIQTQLDNKAPSGYGLGSTSAKYCTDANTATTIGFYELAGANALNTPTGNYKYGVMLVERRQNMIYQTIRYQNNRAIRYSPDGGTTWEDWEILDDEVVMDLKNLGESIPESSDLNTYTTPGNYYSGGSAISASLANTPITSGGFRLIIMNSYTGNTHQHVYGNSNSIYFRTKTSTDTWSEWVNLSKTTLTDLGITATADEINKLDGLTATTTELNYVDGVTSNIQTQLSSCYSSSISRTANTVLAAPNGSAGGATFRKLVAADLPTIPITKGGTESTTPKEAQYRLLKDMNTSDYDVTSTDQIVIKYSSPSTTNGTVLYKTADKFLNYINSNADFLPLSGGTLDSGATIIVPSGERSARYGATGLSYSTPTSTSTSWSSGIYYYNNDRSSTLGVIGAHGKGEAVTHFFIGGTYNDPEVKVIPDKGLVLTTNNYGTSLPTAGTAGRIFFKKVSS